MRIDILLTVYNGMPYVREQIASVQAQTHEDWVLWVRDDGSSDETVEALREIADADPRVRLLDGGRERMGAAAGFGWLLERMPVDARYVMFCDQDDFWLPRKIELTLDAMRGEEERSGRDAPVLVHTDMIVADEELRVIDRSLWHFQGVAAQDVSLNRLLIRNTVTGCTTMINRPLAELAVPVPSAAVMHDWWLALIARCFGRIVSLPESQILYRQHGRNAFGAQRHPRGVKQFVQRALQAPSNTPALREGIRQTALQAAALLERFEASLSRADRELLRRYAEIQSCSGLRRKFRFLRLGVYTYGWGRNLGLILRA